MVNTLKFKTNINCNGCIAMVTPFLNEVPEIKTWDVEINNPDKILTIEGERIKEKLVVDTLAKAGYRSSLI
jgi:copper chaperone